MDWLPKSKSVMMIAYNHTTIHVKETNAVRWLYTLIPHFSSYFTHKTNGFNEWHKKDTYTKITKYKLVKQKTNMHSLTFSVIQAKYCADGSQ